MSTHDNDPAPPGYTYLPIKLYEELSPFDPFLLEHGTPTTPAGNYELSNELPAICLFKYGLDHLERHDDMKTRVMAFVKEKEKTVVTILSTLKGMKKVLEGMTDWYGDMSNHRRRRALKEILGVRSSSELET